MRVDHPSTQSVDTEEAGGHEARQRYLRIQTDGEPEWTRIVPLRGLYGQPLWPLCPNVFPEWIPDYSILIIPRFTAVTSAWVRSETPSLEKTLAT